MGAIWGISPWAWIAVGAVAFVACIVIARVLLAAFASVRELADSLELSARMMRSTLEATRDEVSRTQEGLSRLGRRDETREPWRDW